MAKPRKSKGPLKDAPTDEVMTSAEPLEEAPEIEVSPEEPLAAKAPEEPPAAPPEGAIRITCPDAGAVISSADGKLIGPLPHEVGRPAAPTIFWVDGPQKKRRQLVLQADSPVELEVTLRRVTRRAGAVPIPMTDAAKAAAKKHADEVEAAIAAAESKRGQPGFRKSPRQEVPDIKLSARQYVRSRGFRWEQCAGFLHDMKTQFGAGAKNTRPEWAKLWDAFKTRPVK